MDLGGIAMKRYSASPKLQHYWNLTIRWFRVISRTLVGGPYLSAMVQSVYSTAPADRAKVFVLVGFNGISNIIGHLLPNPFYTYILDI